MKILITGAAGFIARNLAAHLSDFDCGLYGIDIKPCPESIEDYYDVYETLDLLGDVSTEWFDQYLENNGINVVFHLAAIAVPSIYVQYPLTTIRANLNLGMKVFDSAIKNECKIIFTSTSEIYGIGLLGSMTEDSIRCVDTPGTLRWNYADSKAVLEHILFAYKHEAGYDDFVIFRLFNAAGRGIDNIGANNVISSMVSRMLNDEKIIVTKPGIQTRCFSDISDIVRAIASPVHTIKNFADIKGDVYNIGNPDNIATIHGLAVLIIEAFSDIYACDSKIGARWKDWKPQIEMIDAEKFHGSGYSEVMSRIPVIDRFTNLTSIFPQINLEKIVYDTIYQHIESCFDEDEKFSRIEPQSIVNQ